MSTHSKFIPNLLINESWRENISKYKYQIFKPAHIHEPHVCQNELLIKSRKFQQRLTLFVVSAKPHRVYQGLSGAVMILIRPNLDFSQSLKILATTSHSFLLLIHSDIQSILL